jgi:hypothetical protein
LDFNNFDRRHFLKAGAAVGGIALAGTSMANRHPHPRPTSLQYLDRNMYRKNTDVLAHYGQGQHRGGKMQMMAIGERRFLFQQGDVIEVTNPLKPALLGRNAFLGGQIQLAYNNRLGKWILMTGRGSRATFSSPKWPHGKYDNPLLIEGNIKEEGLRGVRFYDASNPEKLALLSQWSCDQGDPLRKVQEGAGVHRSYYDGGRYAYLDAGPDNTFVHMESPVRYYTNCLQVIDVADPSQPRFVCNWWIPGQRKGEEAEYRKWAEYGDKESFTSKHGPMYVPVKLEDGGKLGYSSWGSFGMIIHDLTDIQNPRVVSRWLPPGQKPGAIHFHTIDIARLNRGFVIANPEVLNPDCNERYQPIWVIDVKDPANPRAISKLPVPLPPAEAPYKDFCDRRGRFGPHNPPHIKAPGRPHPNFTAYSFFNAGLQLFDVADLANPKSTGYFVPPQSGHLDQYDSYPRDTDNVFIEWDRKLMWVGTGTGIYLITSPLLGAPVLKPMKIAEWVLPGLNAGHA